MKERGTCWEEEKFQQEREGEKREERSENDSNSLYTCMNLSKIKKNGRKVGLSQVGFYSDRAGISRKNGRKERSKIGRRKEERKEEWKEAS